MTAFARNHYLEETIVHWKHIAPIIHEPQNHAEYEKLADMLSQLLNIVGEIGSQGVVSEILNGKRQLNLSHIKKLALRFGVKPATFID